MNEWLCTCIAKCVMRKSVYMRSILQNMRVKGSMWECICVWNACNMCSKKEREKENMNIPYVLKVYYKICEWKRVLECTCALKYILIRCEERREKIWILRMYAWYWSVEKWVSKRERMHAYTRASMCGTRKRNLSRFDISQTLDKYWRLKFTFFVARRKARRFIYLSTAFEY